MNMQMDNPHFKFMMRIAKMKENSMYLLFNVTLAMLHDRLDDVWCVELWSYSMNRITEISLHWTLIQHTTRAQQCGLVDSCEFLFLCNHRYLQLLSETPKLKDPHAESSFLNYSWLRKEKHILLNMSDQFFLCMTSYIKIGNSFPYGCGKKNHWWRCERMRSTWNDFCNF